MRSEMHSAGITTGYINMPKRIAKQLAERLVGRSEPSIRRRWSILNGKPSQNGQSNRNHTETPKKHTAIPPTLEETGSHDASVDHALETSVEPSPSQPPQDAPVKGPTRKDGHESAKKKSRRWSIEEKETLSKLTEGHNRQSKIDWAIVAAQLSSSSERIRTIEGCKQYWLANIRIRNSSNGMYQWDVLSMDLC